MPRVPWSAQGSFGVSGVCMGGWVPRGCLWDAGGCSGDPKGPWGSACGMLGVNVMHLWGALTWGSHGVPRGHTRCQVGSQRVPGEPVRCLGGLFGVFGVHMGVWSRCGVPRGAHRVLGGPHSACRVLGDMHAQDAHGVLSRCLGWPRGACGGLKALKGHFRVYMGYPGTIWGV